MPTELGAKKAAVFWKQYQTRPPSDAEMWEWGQRFWQQVTAGVGIVTGSGLTVVDIDTPEAEAWISSRVDLPETATVKTRRGKHLYFASPGQTIPKRVALAGVEGLDICGACSIVIAPPTPFIDGSGQYEWLIDPRRALAQLPAELAQLICAKREPKPVGNANLAALFSPVPEGRRNNTLMREGGKWLSEGMKEEEVAQFMRNLNQQCAVPPLPEQEVENTIQSLLQRHAKGGTRPQALDPSQAELVRRMYQNGATCTELARLIGVSRSTVHRAVKNAESYIYLYGVERPNGRKPARDKAQPAVRRSVSKTSCCNQRKTERPAAKGPRRKG